ncbi:Ribosomal protein arginine N-methyltransferase rmt3 [Xanthoria parietina]
MSPSDLPSETSDDALEPNTLDDEDDWKDIESEDFGTSFVSFGGTTKFSDLHDFLQDAKENHGVDLLGLKSSHGLETYGMIKLINYAREQVGRGLFRPDASPESFLEGDRYMKPFMDDDALLYSIDDILDVANEKAHRSAKEPPNGRVSDEDVQELLRQSDQLREQVKYYRNAYQEAYLENLDLKERKGSEPKEHTTDHSHNRQQLKYKDHDTHYFSSYDHSDIHETMLRDTVRTDAYRDFIYENKNIFAGKVVLDVGCGSGILSLFCARAGAAKVIAVDNSSIINKAREIVYVNGLSDTIQCLSGKIEELVLPVKQVDIIVSEWMGYCLMYEAMLDSVLWARDRYLAPDGLMVPSHATLKLSLLADDEEIADKVAYWSSVYGFDMSCMLARAHDEVEIRTVRPKAVPSRSEVILQLPLHTIGKDELTFNGVDFVLEAERNIDHLHGFVIHFDIAFAVSRDHNIQEAKVIFSTGPSGRETHWQQALALIDTSGAKVTSFKRGERVSGWLGLRKGDEKSRDLEVTINWRTRTSTADSEATYQQSWWMH